MFKKVVKFMHFQRNVQHTCNLLLRKKKENSIKCANLKSLDDDCILRLL